MLRMTNQAFDLLAYSQSPKTTKRTTFQDELEAAISVRAGKTTSLARSERLDEDGFDFLDSLLKSRKSRCDAFKASRTKSKISDFDFADDDDDEGTTKRTSFLKSAKRIPAEGDAMAPQHEADAASPFQITRADDLADKKDGVPPLSRRPGDDDAATSPSERSDGAPPDLPPALRGGNSPAPVGPERRADASGPTPCEGGARTSSDAEVKRVEKETPKPKPRQRTVGPKLRVTEKSEASPSAPPAGDSGRDVADVSTLERIATGSCSPNVGPFLFYLERLNDWIDPRPVIDTLPDGRRDEWRASSGVTLGETEEEVGASLEDSNQESREGVAAGVQNKSDVRPSSSQSKKANSVCAKKVESKYLGTLKILDCNVSQDCQPQSADFLRATVYQEWLQKKREKSSENSNKQKIVQDQKKKVEEEKKKIAAASYDAWKEKKDEMLKAKTREDRLRMREERIAVEKGEEKRKAAQRMFHQWKREHDHLLREKSRQQREAERKMALKKREDDEERRRDSQSAFSNWCEKKTDALCKKISTERQENKNKAEEFRYIQEEKDKLAMETFEHWLAKKDMQQKRQKEERRIQVILRDSPPPPWSPPNKTVQFRK